MMNVRCPRQGVLFAFAVMSAIGVTGCAHRQTAPADRAAADPRSISDILNEDPRDPEKSGVIAVQDDGDLIFRGTKLKNSKFDLPVTVNSRVEYWVDYFCGKGRVHFERYLERSEFFIPFIEPLLRQQNMPRDLVYLSMIESGFNNLAKSRAKAVGPWQFMPFTGRRYGLEVNWWVDERRDIRKSTLAAIEYLRDLYNMFGSWELAAAGYNAGEAKVARAIQRYGTRDFWALARHRFLRPETRDYVPKMIAAAIIGKNREQFGFKVQRFTPAPDEAIAPSGELVKVIKSESPQRDEVPDEMVDVPNSDEPEGNAPVEVANGTADGDDEVREDEEGESEITQDDKDAPRVRPVATPHLTRDGEIRGEELAEIELKSSIDLLQVAAASGLSYQTVKSLNPELLRWCTPPHAKAWRIKLPSSVRKRFLDSYNGPGFQRQVQFMTYEARSGDTLSRIAARFGIRVDPIAEMNRISSKAKLRKGTRVLLPLPLDRSRSLASLEVNDPPERRARAAKVRREKRTKRMSYRVGESDRQAARSQPWKPGKGNNGL